MRAVRPAIGVVALSMLLFGLVACGGGDESDEPPAATQAPTAEAQATDEPEVTAEPEATEVQEGDGASSDVDPCALLTREEAEAAAGASLAGPEQETFDAGEGTLASCTYNPGDIPQVGVLVYASEDEDEVAAYFDLGREQYETVTGVGDDAYWAGPPFWNLEVLSGNFVVSITVMVDDEQAALESAKELAATAVGRLP